MDMDLYRIVYCSRNRVAEERQNVAQDHELEQILRSARKNNGALDVTGALLFNEEYFAQVLEGPRLAVEEIFERIQRDRRHGQVTVVDNGWTEHRDFPTWAMAHVRPKQDQNLDGLAATLNLALINPHESGTEVLDLLKSLVAED